MLSTIRHALPFLSSGQAQKEITHNEALQLLDFLVAPAVLEMNITVPPTSPTPGTAYIIGASPVGSFEGKESFLAGWTDNGWRFLAPVEGMQVFIQARGLFALYSDGAWSLGRVSGNAFVVEGLQVVSERASAIADPAGGTAVDVECRAAVAAILGAMRGHGLIAA